MDKAPDAFRTISEVADELDVPQHVLRFWESRFPQIKPMKRAGGRRYYRPDDVDLLRGIRHLLYGEGYTIRGVQRILREQGPKFVQAVWRPGAEQPEPTPEPEPEEAAPEAVPQLEPDDAARTLFGLLQWPGRDTEPAPVPMPPPRVAEPEVLVRPPPPPRPAEPDLSVPKPAAIAMVPVAPVPPVIAASGLTRDDARRLQSALHELGECRRLLDDALKDEAA